MAQLGWELIVLDSGALFSFPKLASKGPNWYRCFTFPLLNCERHFWLANLAASNKAIVESHNALISCFLCFRDGHVVVIAKKIRGKIIWFLHTRITSNKLINLYLWVYIEFRIPSINSLWVFTWSRMHPDNLHKLKINVTIELNFSTDVFNKNMQLNWFSIFL